MGTSLKPGLHRKVRAPSELDQVCAPTGLERIQGSPSTSETSENVEVRVLENDAESVTFEDNSKGFKLRMNFRMPTHESTFTRNSHFSHAVHTPKKKRFRAKIKRKKTRKGKKKKRGLKKLLRFRRKKKSKTSVSKPKLERDQTLSSEGSLDSIDSISMRSAELELSRNG